MGSARHTSPVEFQEGFHQELSNAGVMLFRRRKKIKRSSNSSLVFYRAGIE
jgi:hypothetical protein